MKIKSWTFKTLIVILFLGIELDLPKNAPGQTEPQNLNNKINQYYKLVDIQIIGNKKTKNFVILREMQSQPGDSVSIETLEVDQKRIQNLGLFTRVEFHLEPQAESFILFIVVTERWFLFPYPIYFRNQKDWNKWSYGFGLAHTNMRGRHESLDLSFYLGYSKKVSVTYAIPWFISQWKIYAAFNLYLAKEKSRNLAIAQFHEIRQTFAYSIGKRFGHFSYLDFTMAYNNFRTDTRDNSYTLAASGQDEWLSYLLNFKFDNRDLYEFPRSGWLLKTYWQKSGRKNRVINYSRLGIDLRRYFPLPGGTTLAFRSDLELSRGHIPIYDHLYLGYSERIRGHFFSHAEGENRCISGVAFRFPLRKITYHSFFQDTPAADYYRNLKFGISAGIFVDAGTVWYQNESLALDKFNVGWGFGLFFHLPYVDLARIEYAFNEELAGQFILFDLGVAF